MPTLVSHMSQRLRGLAALVMVTVLAVTSSGAYAEGIGGPAVGSAGAVGIGDPYFPLDGNGGIDVVHYDIHDRYDFDRRRLSGRTRLTIRATQTLSRFNLDLLLPVKQVLVDGVAAAYTKPAKHELQITPRTLLPSGTTFTVDVRYRGKPGAISYLEEQNWLASSREVVTMNEPHMAPWWFPANDHPLDKASFDVHITVPSDRKVIGNGRLVSRKVRGRSATTHWRASEPMAPYLAFFAAGRFETHRGRHDGRPWYVAVSKQLPVGQRSGLVRLMKKSPRITAWLERQLGAYPFSTTGGVVTGLRVDFALENQTRPIYPAISSDNVSLVVHELAHQWFGNSVSVEGWSDIWINEGFATFLEWRYDETHGGHSGEAWLRDAYRAFPAASGFWKVTIGDPGPARLFDGAVYDRGAMTLQALRHVVGETDFWAILRTWLAARRHGTGSVADFRVHAEAVSGVDLDGFFTAWLDTPARPADIAANGLG